MKKFPFINLFLMLVCTTITVAAKEKTDNNAGTKIDDEDKTSSRIMDMFSNVETLQKAQKAASGVVSTGKAVVTYGKEIKETGLKDYIKENAKLTNAADKAKDASAVYKTARGGLWSLLKHISKQTAKVMDKAKEHVNRWQTTLPTIRAYKKGAERWCSDTYRTAIKFKFSDGFDVTRKWDRQMQVHSDYARGLMTNFWLLTKQRYDDVGEDWDDMEKTLDQVLQARYRNLYMQSRADGLRTGSDENMVLAYLEVTGKMSEQRKVPKTIMADAGETFWMVHEISQRYHGVDGAKSMTKENALLDSIAVRMEAEKKTYEDERDLAAFINKRRQMLQADIVTLQQLRANMAVEYGRLKLWDYEMYGEQKQKTKNDWAKVAGGQAGKIDR